MSNKLKVYEILYWDEGNSNLLSDADMKNVVMVSTSKHRAIIDLVNEVNVYRIDSIRLLTEVEYDRQ